MVKRHNQPFRLFKRGEIYHAYFSFLSEGQRVRFRESTGAVDEQSATDYCIKRISEITIKNKELASGELPGITIADAFARFYEEKGKYYSQSKALLQRLIRIKDNVKVTYLHELDKKALSDFVNLRKQKVSNSTINRELAALSAIRTLARDFWECRINQTRPFLFKQIEPAEHIKFLPDWDYAQKIIDRATPTLRPIIYAALYTGMRRGNILNLKWEDINFADNTISILVKDKNTLGGKNQTIPFVPQMRELLLEQPRINEYVFNRNGKPIKNINRDWYRIFYKEDKNRKFTKELKDPELPYINFHALRHTFATWVLRKTNNLRTTKELLGHSNINTTMKYAHILDADKRHALNLVFDKTCTICAHNASSKQNTIKKQSTTK
ncbi:MAG: tyrosine-type recombinase/integrase [Alphaproteobacteria bacterium]